MAGYTRQDSNDNIATGKVINASDFDNEYNAIEGAFSNSSGHKHDGTGGEGARITVIGSSGQVSTDSTTVFTTSNAVVGLGKAGNVWKDLFVDNIKIDGNTITSENTNGNIVLTPNGDGLVTVADGDLQFGSTPITATGAELNIMDGSATTQATVTLAAGDGVVISDGDVMKQALVSDFSVYTASSTQTLTNKTIDANGTGNSITNIEVADLASGVLDTDLSSTSVGDTTLASAKAIKAYVDSGTATFTNKTIDANGTGNSVTNLEVADLASGVLDTDLASVSGSDDTLASAKAIKTYVDAQNTAQDLDIQGDSGGALSIDLDAHTLDIAGGTGIDTSGSGQTVTVAIDSTVATLTGSQTLTTKTLTTPKILENGYIADDDGNKRLAFVKTGTATHYLKIQSTNGSGVIVTSSADDGSNANLELQCSGTGTVWIPTANLTYAGTTVTATGAELNYNDITTLGTSEASKVVTAAASGAVTITGELNASGGINEDHNNGALSNSNQTLTLDCHNGNNFSVTTAANITSFVVSNLPASGTAFFFTLKVSYGGSHSITWGSSVKWNGGSAPTLSTSGTDVFAFYTVDSGTTIYGFTAGQALA
jgi:hypothetical protein